MIILWCIRDFSRSDLRNLFKDMQRILRLLKIMSKCFRTTFPLNLIGHVERQRLCYKTAKKQLHDNLSLISCRIRDIWTAVTAATDLCGFSIYLSVSTDPVLPQRDYIEADGNLLRRHEASLG